jgi:hypothetical protein
MGHVQKLGALKGYCAISSTQMRQAAYGWGNADVIRFVARLEGAPSARHAPRFSQSHSNL